MIRGYYTAASGMVTQEKRLNTYADNLANVSTSGFRKENIIVGTFGEHMAVRMDGYQRNGTRDIGSGVLMQTAAGSYTDYTQGGLEDTGRPYDFAILGEGFFLIVDDDGNEYLTRDGQFIIDNQGAMALPGLGRLQGDYGVIEPESSDFQLNADGEIYYYDPEDDDPEGMLIGRVMVVEPLDYEGLRKAPNGLFIAEGGYQEVADLGGATVTVQHVVERSNVNVAEEMARMMESQRSLQSCSTILRMYDELSEQMNSRVARL